MSVIDDVGRLGGGLLTRQGGRGCGSEVRQGREGGRGMRKAANKLITFLLFVFGFEFGSEL